MHQRDDILGSSQSDYEAWRDLLRSRCGRYYSEGIEPNAFTGWVRPVSARGFTAMDIGCNSHRVERTRRDVRLDGADHYFVVFLVDGQLAMTHNDQTVRLAAGDVAFVDAARPVTYFADSEGALWNTVSLNLPRQSLVSHLGLEPQSGLYRRAGTPERRPGVCSSMSFERSITVTDRRIHPPIPTCSWQSMIWSAHSLHHPTRRPSRATPTSCSAVSAASLETALPTPILVLAMRQPKLGSRCVTCRNSSRSTGRPAVNSSTRFVWNTPRIFCIAGRCWAPASLSAKSPTLVASATTRISHENFVIGSVTRQARTMNEMAVPATERRAPLPAAMR